MKESIEITKANKDFIKKLLSQRLPLSSFPDHVHPDFVLTEPKVLPFGGKYTGFKEYEKVVPKIMGFYDFDRFTCVGVYGDDDSVFGLLKIGVINSEAEISLCEQFVFKDGKISEINVFVSD